MHTPHTSPIGHSLKIICCWLPGSLHWLNGNRDSEWDRAAFVAWLIWMVRGGNVTDSYTFVLYSITWPEDEAFSHLFIAHVMHKKWALWGDKCLFYVSWLHWCLPFTNRQISNKTALNIYTSCCKLTFLLIHEEVGAIVWTSAFLHDEEL